MYVCILCVGARAYGHSCIHTHTYVLGKALTVQPWVAIVSLLPVGVGARGAGGAGGAAGERGHGVENECSAPGISDHRGAQVLARLEYAVVSYFCMRP